jgi:hypothetical protein
MADIQERLKKLGHVARTGMFGSSSLEAERSGKGRWS